MGQIYGRKCRKDPHQRARQHFPGGGHQEREEQSPGLNPAGSPSRFLRVLLGLGRVKLAEHWLFPAWPVST